MGFLFVGSVFWAVLLVCLCVKVCLSNCFVLACFSLVYRGERIYLCVGYMM